jgi:four helix bundle protein
MSGEIRSYRDLDVWSRGIDLAVSAYEVTVKLPVAERYGLSRQIQRAAASISANVAEGYELKGRSYLRHVNIALGSLAELETHIEISLRLGFVTPDQTNGLLNQAVQVGQMLNGLRRALRRRIVGELSASAGLIVLVAVCAAML